MGGFRDFLFRGNLIQLAVAVVIGTAFTNVITAITTGMVTPLLGIFGGQPNFNELYFSLNGSQFKYGSVIDSLITFFITAVVLYYVVVLPSDWVIKRLEENAADAQRECSECWSKIDKRATRCAFCTASVIPQVKWGTEVSL
ncbi:Large-conductance mechanosensitive channel [Folsomia candida]|uniref:Large-conductance mechanosensitive channel n=1 Tax=Folsomia candida TaxID=158441 RepID=A0A226F2E8_FOLCA|nr:Large-conductance mechanosensitive channel [Folsomia candida]